MQQRIVLAIAILAGILAFGLTHRYLKNERERITAGYKKVLVLAAKKDLPAGTVLARLSWQPAALRVLNPAAAPRP